MSCFEICGHVVNDVSSKRQDGVQVLTLPNVNGNLKGLSPELPSNTERSWSQTSNTVAQPAARERIWLFCSCGFYIFAKPKTGIAALPVSPPAGRAGKQLPEPQWGRRKKLVAQFHAVVLHFQPCLWAGQTTFLQIH